MRDDGNFDEIDELFEPFELDDAPPIGDLPPPPPPPVAPASAPVATAGATATVSCPSCGSHNPITNQHCEQCGARLGRDPLPVAPPPAGGTSPGMRALGMLAAILLVVALGALIINSLRGGPTEAAPSSTSSTTTTQPPVVTELTPSTVVASSELASLPATNLIDGDPSTYWNDDSLKGDGAWITFRFARPVQIRELRIQNLVDEEKFKRNYRIKGYRIKVDDLDTEITGRLDDSNVEQRIPVASLDTTELTLEVTSTYPAQAVGDATAYSELALAEVRFLGVEK